MCAIVKTAVDLKPECGYLSVLEITSACSIWTGVYRAELYIHPWKGMNGNTWPWGWGSEESSLSLRCVTCRLCLGVMCWGGFQSKGGGFGSLGVICLSSGDWCSSLASSRVHNKVMMRFVCFCRLSVAPAVVSGAAGVFYFAVPLSK